MNGPSDGRGRNAGSSLVEMCIWSFLILVALIGFERGFLKRYRGFKEAIQNQNSRLKP